MYKSASEYYGNKSHLFEPYKGVKEMFSHFPIKPSKPNEPIEKFTVNPPKFKPAEIEHDHVSQSSLTQEGSNITWEKKHVTNIASPNIQGPPFWFNLHLSAAHYPKNPNNYVKNVMKYRILAIPIEIVCRVCKTHASAYIESHRDQLDYIVSSREKLFEFFVKFHNKVNERKNKPIVSVEDAWKMYTGGVDISYMTYS